MSLLLNKNWIKSIEYLFDTCISSNININGIFLILFLSLFFSFLKIPLSFSFLEFKYILYIYHFKKK